jgi:hypothetical protein
MALRILSGGMIAALAGAAMLAASSDPSPAFTQLALAQVAGRGRRRRASLVARRLASRLGLASWMGMAQRLASLGLGAIQLSPLGLARLLRGGYGVRRCWIGRWGYRHCAWW